MVHMNDILLRKKNKNSSNKTNECIVERCPTPQVTPNVNNIIAVPDPPQEVVVSEGTVSSEEPVSEGPVTA